MLNSPMMDQPLTKYVGEEIEGKSTMTAVCTEFKTGDAVRVMLGRANEIPEFFQKCKKGIKKHMKSEDDREELIKRNAEMIKANL